MSDAATATTQGAKVLIVDDTPANLDLLRKILAPAGYQIFFATSGESALRVATEVLPNLILLDVMMPRMDGFETCRRLKMIDAVKDIPVIFVTARTEMEDLTRGFDVGGVDYITKPIKQPEVDARVKTHLQIQALIRQQEAHLAELQELNATKDKFFSILGKDLRAPLAAIAQVSEALRGAADGDRAGRAGIERQLAGASATAEKVLGLLETLLEWPRVQRGQKLDLFDSPVTDRDLASLVQGLGTLRFLSLANTEVTDEGLAHVAQLTDLEELHLDHTAVSDAGIRLLVGLHRLRILDLKGTQVTDAGLAHLRSLTALQGLYLTRTAVTNEGLRHLAALRDLRILILWETAVSDAGLHHLHGLKRLGELILWSTRVTPKGVAALSKALPHCDISADMAE
jgi:CheY-like chemotaxis protein